MTTFLTSKESASNTPINQSPSLGIVSRTVEGDFDTFLNSLNSTKALPPRFDQFFVLLYCSGVASTTQESSPLNVTDTSKTSPPFDWYRDRNLIILKEPPHGKWFKTLKECKKEDVERYSSDKHISVWVFLMPENKEKTKCFRIPSEKLGKIFDLLALNQNS